MLLRSIMLVVALFSTMSYATIGANSVSGKITNITSTTEGYLVRIGSNEIPHNCSSTNSWIEIKQKNTAMMSMTLTAWTLGRDVLVYTSSTSKGYCQAVQVDPKEK